MTSRIESEEIFDDVLALKRKRRIKRSLEPFAESSNKKPISDSIDVYHCDKREKYLELD